MSDKKTHEEQMVELREAWGEFMKVMLAWETLRFMVVALVVMEAVVISCYFLGIGT